jgi:lysozyme
VGTGAACSSTLVRKLRADPPDYPGACRELLRWDKQAGRVLAGLTRRRQAEYQTCVGDATTEGSS